MTDQRVLGTIEYKGRCDFRNQWGGKHCSGDRGRADSRGCAHTCARAARSRGGRQFSRAGRLTGSAAGGLGAPRAARRPRLLRQPQEPHYAVGGPEDAGNCRLRYVFLLVSSWPDRLSCQTRNCQIRVLVCWFCSNLPCIFLFFFHKILLMTIKKNYPIWCSRSEVMLVQTFRRLRSYFEYFSLFKKSLL